MAVIQRTSDIKFIAPVSTPEILLPNAVYALDLLLVEFIFNQREGKEGVVAKRTDTCLRADCEGLNLELAFSPVKYKFIM